MSDGRFWDDPNMDISSHMHQFGTYPKIDQAFKIMIEHISNLEVKVQELEKNIVELQLLGGKVE